MTATTPPALHVPVHPVRFVTAASLFDGHDAAINVMRRLLQAQGAEVVHLGHDRSVDAVVAGGGARRTCRAWRISSYQGGHVEYFSYLVERLAEAGAGHVQVFGGGGGRDRPGGDRRCCASAGCTIFAPEDGQRLGLPGMINELIRACDVDLDRAGAGRRGAAHRRPGGAGPRDHRARGGPFPGAGRAACARRPPGAPCRSSASPAPAGRASPR